ncbi:MAG: MGMT family protein [Sedimentisphaerales bacterium]|nr:MGMT family protein [Sedimentisphaerales bacterium]
MLVPAPLMVDELVWKVRKGKLVTVGQLRAHLAARFDADSTCPMTMGIFLGIVAQAEEEDKQEGKNRIAPCWRVIKEDDSMNLKFPGGVEAQSSRLESEEHRIPAHKGKNRLKFKVLKKPWSIYDNVRHTIKQRT